MTSITNPFSIVNTFYSRNNYLYCIFLLMFCTTVDHSRYICTQDRNLYSYETWLPWMCKNFHNFHHSLTIRARFFCIHSLLKALRFSALSTSDNFSLLGLTACARFFRIHSLLEALRFSTLSTPDNFSLLGLTVYARFFRIYFLLEALRFSALSTSDNFSLLGLTACASFFCMNSLLVVI